jgi:hypothetical protein
MGTRMTSTVAAYAAGYEIVIASRYYEHNMRARSWQKIPVDSVIIFREGYCQINSRLF